MATVYSGEVSVGSYNRIRIKCDYSGTSATLAVQFRRTSSYNGSWSDSGAKLTFNGTTKSAAYSYSGTVGTSWVTLKGNITGYTVSTSGGTYNWSFTNPNGGTLACSGTLTIPAQATAPTAPTISAATYSSTQINVTYGTTNLGNPSGTVYLYNGTSSNPTTQIASKTTTGNSTYNNTGLTANTRYYYKATATNSAGSASSSVVNAVTSPAGITSITGGSLTSSSIALTLVFASSGSALTTTAQISSNNSSWSDTSMTNVQGTTKTYTISGLAANTSYTRYFRVHTSVGNSGVKSFTWATKPANITSATATNIGETTATIAVACGASGSAATTDLQISSDNVNWTTVASNVQGTTKNVSVTGLTPNSSVTRYFRVHTVYGNSATYTVTFTTLKIAHLYGSVNNQTKRVTKLYGSVNGQTKKVVKLYGSENGVTKLLYRG